MVTVTGGTGGTDTGTHAGTDGTVIVDTQATGHRRHGTRDTAGSAGVHVRLGTGTAASLIVMDSRQAKSARTPTLNIASAGVSRRPIRRVSRRLWRWAAAVGGAGRRPGDS